MNGSPGVAGLGTYLPETVRGAAEISSLTGIPEDVIRRKFGIDEVRVAGPGEHVTDMAAAASRAALDGFDPARLDLVLYCGSEYKDHLVWSAASEVARRVGARGAAAFEVYALCAGMPVALKTVRGLMAEDPDLETALVVAASRENDLVDYSNARARFMSNFGAGAAALLLRRGHANPVLGTAILTDSSFARDVIMPAGGSRLGAPVQPFGQGQSALDVPDPAGMKARLDGLSLEAFGRVTRRALGPTGAARPDFVALTHMKRSMHEAVLQEVAGHTTSVYLSDTGHVQAADQVIALERGLRQGLVGPGSLVLLLAAGIGYTWSAAALRWEEPA
jgi:3-oxoacyl-[acyl-carrier-protein] synthase III